MPKQEFPKLVAAIIATSSAAAVAAMLAPASAQNPPNGKQVVERVCTACHDLSPIMSSGFSRRDWETVVQSMIDMGAVISAEDVTVITNYLAATYPPRAQK